MIIQNLIISCLFALVPFSQNVQDQQCNVQLVEKKVKDNYYSNGYYRYYNMGDLVSTNFFRDVVNYYPQTYGSGYNWLSVNSSSVGSATFNVNGAYSIYWYNNSNQDELIFNPSSFIMSKVIDSTRSNAYMYSFTFGNSSNQSLSFYFYTHSNSVGSHLGISGSAWTGISVNECMAYCTLREDLSNANHEIGRFFGYYDNTQMNNAYQSGYDEGYDVGYSTGNDEGYNTGYSTGQTEGYNNGYTAGDNAGYQRGYSEGYGTALSGGESAVIFGGIMDVAFIPVNVFFQMFNYEVFGINIAGFVSGLLTIAIVIIIFKFILGRKI